MGLVVLIQVVVFRNVGQARYRGYQWLVCMLSASLAAVGLKGLHINAQGNAGFAAIAIRTVGEQATAAKALGNQIGIGVVVDQVTGSSYLRSRLLVIQVAARVGGSGIKLQGLKR